MSHQKKQENIIQSMIVQLEDGQEKELLSVKEQKEVITDIVFQSLTMKNPKSKKISDSTLFMQESLLKNKKKILKDKPDISNQCLKTIPLLKTLDQDLIIKERGFKPFWNNFSKEISKELWLPTKIGLQDLDLTSSNGYLNNSEQYWNQLTEQQNQEKKNCSEMLWKCSQFLQQDITEVENTKIRTMKIRIYPNKEQKQHFKHCFGVSRYFYNKSIDEINKRYKDRKDQFNNKNTCIHCNNKKEENSWSCSKHLKKEIKWNLKITLPSIRPIVMSSDENVSNNMLWQKEVAFDTRQMAINDAVKSYVSSVSLLKMNKIKKFDLKYKTKKNKYQIFWVNYKAITKDYKLFTRRLKSKSKLRIRKKQRVLLSKLIPNGIDSFCKIQKSGKNIYHLIISYEKKDIINKNKKDSFISLDPGERIFQSGYSSDNKCYQFGIKQMEQIKRIHKKIDNLKSLRSTNFCSKTKNKNYKNKIDQYDYKVLNIVNNLHNQVSSFLSKKYKTIIIGKLNTHKILKSCGLNNKINRLLHVQSHYKFRIKLNLLCKDNKSNLIVQEEQFTTKTCGNCGCINENVGSNKIFNCDKCNLIADRDFHAARNILIKFLTLNQ